MKIILSTLAVTLFSMNAFAVKPATVLTFTDATILAPLKGSTITAGYGKIKNNSDEAVVLTVVEAKPFKAVELHESKEVDGKMSMHQLEAIKIAAHELFEFKPGGNHIMFFDPTRAVKAKQKITVTFKANGKTLNEKFTVSERTEDHSEHSHH